ncbi:bifunctional 3-phosphoshikimate 1-carboxyvinyltransferase/cytidylate kinase [Ideonella sp. B7]|uniref:bifunctional 3-phosphoshikimate 1-carboxyvinyltransferase/cytidylate kinase n=1 Tax=Ideonella benzenivorans TaxID=2831643 RepID=UPI001CEC10D6|nr:bifunctional 3-phosphoshikimate 1-carboxyvinyltransferase/cytidylate kinase [Ideonella benzenivorans]MCA6217799.1 bifunctional 3-phosphoshikimate 1-carboxyvinyltransferase/cytidylate kinase [Ideonella benzenivorans]
MYTTEFLDVPPLVRAGGRVRLPGSKSISNRVLLLAGLAAGTTEVHDLLDSDDTRVMLDALRQLGCALERDGDVLKVTGLGGQLAQREAPLFLGNAGTAMRPLTAALAVLAATQGGRFQLSGVARMHERPIGDLVQALRQLGCPVTDLGEPGFPPLQVGDGTLHALNTATPIRVRGDVSSQFLTALLLALPLVTADGPVTIEVDGELISKPYIDITLRLLARFGITVQREGYQRFVLPQGSAYRTPGRIHVEGDASSASYFIALGTIAGTEAPVRIDGVGLDSIQGDIRFVEAAQAMGAQVTGGPGWLEVRRGAWPLKALTLDCNHIPDAAMTLAVMALYADGPTRLTNIASWRVKETDRIAAMATELRKLGASIAEGEDFIEVRPPAGPWQAASIHTYDDHRMAMCLSLAAFNPLIAGAPGVPVRILDPKCVGKTFPDYFETLFHCVTPAAGQVPVLTVDGPTASGKGTLASELARRLGYHLLDSGALYRATALAAQDAGVSLDDEPALATLAGRLALRFEGQRVFLAGRDITDPLRLESTGGMASRVSVHPAVRQALHQLQLSFRRAPGLVADGRDMGTVVFPDATLKVFLTASVEQRAERRYKQLISKGVSANLPQIQSDLRLRDERDATRTTAPCKPAEDAMLLDNSALSIEDSVVQCLGWWQQRRPF